MFATCVFANVIIKDVNHMSVVVVFVCSTVFTIVSSKFSIVVLIRIVVILKKIIQGVFSVLLLQHVQHAIKNVFACTFIGVIDCLV